MVVIQRPLFYWGGISVKLSLILMVWPYCYHCLPARDKMGTSFYWCRSLLLKWFMAMKEKKICLIL